MADKLLRHSKTDTRRTHGGRGLEARPSGLKADTRGTHGRQKAGTWQTLGLTQGGHTADKVWRRGQSGQKGDARGMHGGRMADKLQGRAARA